MVPLGVWTKEIGQTPKRILYRYRLLIVDLTVIYVTKKAINIERTRCGYPDEGLHIRFEFPRIRIPGRYYKYLVNEKNQILYNSAATSLVDQPTFSLAIRDYNENLTP
jgi:hypothetical protein